MFLLFYAKEGAEMGVIMSETEIGIPDKVMEVNVTEIYSIL